MGGRYTILRLLGTGGMGAVYLVTDSHLASQPMALKEMSNSYLNTPQEKQEALRAFEHEAQLLSKLCHPNLPRVTDFFSEAGKPFLVMDYVQGETLLKIA